MSSENKKEDEKDKKMITDILGWITTVIFSILMLPQIISIIKKKSAQGISMSMLTLQVIGCGTSLAYSILLELWPVVTSNIIIIILTMAILIFRIKEKITKRSIRKQVKSK